MFRSRANFGYPEATRHLPPESCRISAFTNATAAIVNFREWAQKGYPIVKE
jgi:hypothetical protein